MNGLRVFWARFREWIGARRVERDLGEELQHHLDLSTDDYVRRGLSRDDARAAAQRDFGGLDQTREAVRDRRGFRAPGTLAQDVRYALRLLRKTPGFTAAAIVTLALGMGANVAIFSLIDGVLLRPLPYPAADRLVSVWEWNPPRPGSGQANGPRVRSVVAPANLVDYKREARSFTALAGYARVTAVVTGRGTPDRVLAEDITDGYFEALGVRPAIGRTFAPVDYGEGQHVAIISDALWRQRFGGDPLVVGQTLEIDGIATEIAGVLPADFRTPNDERLGDQIRLLRPFVMRPDLVDNRDDHELDVVGRLKNGVSVEAARQEMAAIAAAIGQQFRKGVTTGADLAPLGADQAREVRTLLLTLGGGAAFVLLIACVNVASLLVVRSHARRREIAVRFAMGATRGRVIRELLTQSLVLASIGAIAALGVGTLTRRALLALAPVSLPHLTSVALDGRALLFTAALALLTALIFGLLPAWQVSRTQPNDALRAVDRHVAGTWSLRSRNALMVAEVAISIVLLVGAGLMVRSLVAINRMELGFDPEPVLAANVSLPEVRYPTPAARLAFFEQLETRLANEPGVQSVAFANRFPLRGGWESGLLVEPLTGGIEAAEQRNAGFQAVSTGFFRTLGINLVRGRLFEPADRDGAPAVAVVSEEFGRAILGGGDPIGRRLRRFAAAPSIAIVGVVSDVRRENRTLPVVAQVYLPAAQTTLYPARLAEIAVRTDRPSAPLAAAITNAVWSIDPNQPVAGVRTLAESLSLRLADKHFQTFLFLIFAGLALTLAIVGMYGVVAYAVSQRTAEIGLRMALGADGGRIVRWMLRQALTLLAAGTAIGIVAGYWLSSNVETLLFKVAPTDVVTYVAAPIVLGLTVLAASYLAARKAIGIDAAAVLK
jgi:putative ABC transport system permease protein